MPWPLVWAIVGLLAALLVGWLVALLTLRMGIRTHEDLTRRIMAERLVEKEEAEAEHHVAQEEATEHES